MENGRRDSSAVQLVHLILHQCDERGNDEREPGEQNRRQLKAERLARARRHHGKDIATLENGTNERLLTLPERRVTEVALQIRNEAVCG